jgi:hypothetical protein
MRKRWEWAVFRSARRAAFWERIWSPNSAEPSEMGRMWWNLLDVSPSLTCGFKTNRHWQNPRYVSHNSEFAASGVPCRRPLVVAARLSWPCG